MEHNLGSDEYMKWDLSPYVLHLTKETWLGRDDNKVGCCCLSGLSLSYCLFKVVFCDDRGAGDPPCQ